MNSELRVKPIQDQHIAKWVFEEAREDGHNLFAPTHYVTRHAPEKDVEIVGAFTLSYPFLSIWMHTKRACARDSLFVLQIAENLCSAKDGKALILLCADSSPLFPFIQRLGYTNLGQTIISSKIL